MPEKKCKYCVMMIPEEAKYCPYCRKRQGTPRFVYLVGMLFISVIFTSILFNMSGACERSKDDSKSKERASFIESKVNIGGYSGCQCESFSAYFIRCKLNFDAGTQPFIVEVNVKGVANKFAQAGIPPEILWVGYSGYQKVCEYEYSSDRTVKRK